MKTRKLTAAEVEFTITIEPEDMPVDGAFMSGDPEYAEADKQIEAGIKTRLNRGDDEAWCVVVVTAEWRGHKGHDSLGGCSLDKEYTAEIVAKEHGMQGEALDRLNEQLASVVADLAPVLEAS